METPTLVHPIRLAEEMHLPPVFLLMQAVKNLSGEQAQEFVHTIMRALQQAEEENDLRAVCWAVWEFVDP